MRIGDRPDESVVMTKSSVVIFVSGERNMLDQI